MCDVIIYHAENRFRFAGHLNAATIFSPEKFLKYRWKFPEEILKMFCMNYSFFNVKWLSFVFSTIYTRGECFLFSLPFINLFNFILQNNNKFTFSKSSKLLKVLTTVSMTTAKSERCFSTSKRTKTFLRNTMGQERCLALLMISTERDVIMSTTDFNQKVIEKFAAAKVRRTDFLF